MRPILDQGSPVAWFPIAFYAIALLGLIAIAFRSE